MRPKYIYPLRLKSRPAQTCLAPRAVDQQPPPYRIRPVVSLTIGTFQATTKIARVFEVFFDAAKDLNSDQAWNRCCDASSLCQEKGSSIVKLLIHARSSWAVSPHMSSSLRTLRPGRSDKVSFTQLTGLPSS